MKNNGKMKLDRYSIHSNIFKRSIKKYGFINNRFIKDNSDLIMFTCKALHYYEAKTREYNY